MQFVSCSAKVCVSPCSKDAIKDVLGRSLSEDEMQLAAQAYDPIT